MYIEYTCFLLFYRNSTADSSLLKPKFSFSFRNDAVFSYGMISLFIWRFFRELLLFAGKWWLILNILALVVIFVTILLTLHSLTLPPPSTEPPITESTVSQSPAVMMKENRTLDALLRIMNHPGKL
jgi:hypothetical protein